MTTDRAPPPRPRTDDRRASRPVPQRGDGRRIGDRDARRRARRRVWRGALGVLGVVGAARRGSALLNIVDGSCSSSASLISIFLHETGHFVTARLTGMKATQFFLGFGPRLWSFRRGETEYGVRALPLGAFVRIIGMNNIDEVPPADEARTYRQQSYPRRLLVISAGSIMHMLIAIVLLFAVYVDRRASSPSTPAPTVSELVSRRPGRQRPASSAGRRRSSSIGGTVGRRRRATSATRCSAVDAGRHGRRRRRCATAQPLTIPVGARRQRRPRTIADLRQAAARRVVSSEASEWQSIARSATRPSTASPTCSRPRGSRPRASSRCSTRSTSSTHLSGDERRPRRPARPRVVGVTSVSDDDRRRRQGFVGDPLPARRAQRLRRRVQHVPAAAARRRPRRDRHLRADPRARRAGATSPTSSKLMPFAMARDRWCCCSCSCPGCTSTSPTRSGDAAP